MSDNLLPANLPAKPSPPTVRQCAFPPNGLPSKKEFFKETVREGWGVGVANHRRDQGFCFPSASPPY